jgi:hypothetical protein
MRVFCRLGAARSVCGASKCVKRRAGISVQCETETRVFESGISASRIPPQGCELITVGVGGESETQQFCLSSQMVLLVYHV